MHYKGPQPAELGYHKHAVARIAQAEKGAPWAQDDPRCPHTKMLRPPAIDSFSDNMLLLHASRGSHHFFKGQRWQEIPKERG